MSTDIVENEIRFAVVHNDEEQFSVWPDGRDLPNGWHREGTTGTRQACLDQIEKVWTDMRPRSVR
jgi:MbtH protein